MRRAKLRGLTNRLLARKVQQTWVACTVGFRRESPFPFPEVFLTNFIMQSRLPVWLSPRRDCGQGGHPPYDQRPAYFGNGGSPHAASVNTDFELFMKTDSEARFGQTDQCRIRIIFNTDSDITGGDAKGPRGPFSIEIPLY